MTRLAALLFPTLLPGIAAAGCNTEAAAAVRMIDGPMQIADAGEIVKY